MRFSIALSVLASVVLIACGDDDADAPGAGMGTAKEVEGDSPAEKAKGGRERSGGAGGRGDAADGITIATGDSQFGEILFDEDQQAIYVFDKESTPESECYGACAEAWPPVLTDGDPQAARAVQGGLLGTTERDDGTTQVTYDGQPLYYYVDDPPGEVLCHNVEEFGGLWLVLGADGAALS